METRRLATQSDTCGPSAHLSPFVGAYWSRSGFNDGRTMRVLPDASSYVIFELAGEKAGCAYLVGTLLQPVLIELNGQVGRIGIRLRPGMANLLFGISARDIRQHVSGLDDAYIRSSSSLLEALATTRDFRSRVGAIENWLLGQLQTLRPSAVATQIETAQLFNAVIRGAGPRDLRALVGWSERRIQRFFRDRFGASAATLSRWSRFRRSLAALETKNHPSRATVSAELGYSDQAHMCREFREFSGTDIGSLLSERQNVGNVQAVGQATV